MDEIEVNRDAHGFLIPVGAARAGSSPLFRHSLFWPPLGQYITPTFLERSEG